MTEAWPYTSACVGSRHWNCSGWLRYFFRPWKRKQPCECICHREPEGWRDVAGAFAVSVPVEETP